MIAPRTPAISSSEARLLNAQARAANTDAILAVVDASLRKSAELREQRRAEEEKRRIIEDRLARAAHAEQIEQEDAAKLSQRHRALAESIVRRDEDDRAAEDARAVRTLQDNERIPRPPPPHLDIAA